MNRQKYYDEPRYYDIAFGWSIAREVDFVEAVLKKHGSGGVRSVLELACGTGRFVLELASRGYATSGLDISREMITFSREKAAAQGLLVELALKDMADFALYRKFDAAICMTGSFAYLQPVEQAATHLQRVADHLNTGAIYLIDLAVTGEGGSLPAPQQWTQQRGPVRVSACWELHDWADQERGIAQERLALVGIERGWERRWQQDSLFQLYAPDRFVELVKASGRFEVVGQYADFDLDRPFEAGGHRLLVVLRKIASAADPKPVMISAGGIDRARDALRRPRDGERRGAGPGGRRDAAHTRSRRPSGAGAQSSERQATPDDGKRKPQPSPAPETQASPPPAAGGESPSGAAASKRRRRRRRGGKPAGTGTTNDV